MVNLFLTKWPWLWKLRLFLGLILLVLIMVAGYFKIVPGGRITYSRSWPGAWHSGRGFIGDFKPDNRLDLSDPQSPKIVADPLYFSVFTPRAFDQATVTVTYRDQLSSSTPIVELGVLKGVVAGSYDLQPLQNKLLDYWRAKWPNLTDGGSRLVLDANGSYSSLSAFLADLQTGKLKDCPGGLQQCLAAYNYPLLPNYSWPNQTVFQPLIINQALRGAHQFYLYLDKAPWYLNLSFVYRRQDPKADPIIVNIWSGAKLLMTKTIPDDNSESARKDNAGKKLSFGGSSPGAGVYKVEIKISDDVIIKKIESSSDKLAIINRIWPVAGSGPLVLFTDAGHLRVQTANPASLGQINFGGRTFNLDQADQTFNWSAAGSISSINLRKEDIILEDNGMFAFSAGSLFNPDFKEVDRYFQPGANIKYIIADYQPPLAAGDFKTARAQFSLADANRTDGRYTFLISIPGLNEQTGATSYLSIKKITVSLKGKTLWQKIWNQKN